jgi:hypothetical protein
MKNNFDYYLEKAVQSILDDATIDLGDNKNLIRSSLKRHVQLLVYAQIDEIIKKLVP